MLFDYVLILCLMTRRGEMPSEVSLALEDISVSSVCDRLLIVSSHLQTTCKNRKKYFTT